MSDNLPLVSSPVEQDQLPPDEINLQPQKRNPIKRLGCGILLVFWFVILLSPCVLFYLASNGEIRIWHTDIPEPYAHPRLLIELVTEVDHRGLQLVRSVVVDNQPMDNVLCVQTNVSYMLWQTIEDNQDVSYCDCYMLSDDNTDWLLTGTTPDVCPTTQ